MIREAANPRWFSKANWERERTKATRPTGKGHSSRRPSLLTTQRTEFPWRTERASVCRRQGMECPVRSIYFHPSFVFSPHYRENYCNYDFPPSTFIIHHNINNNEKRQAQAVHSNLMIMIRLLSCSGPGNNLIYLYHHLLQQFLNLPTTSRIQAAKHLYNITHHAINNEKRHGNLNLINEHGENLVILLL